MKAGSDELRAFYRQYYAANADKIRENARVRYYARSDRQKRLKLKSNKAYRERNKERINRQKRDFYAIARTAQDVSPAANNTGRRV